MLYSLLAESTDFVLFCAGKNIRKFVKDGFIISKPTQIHSRSRARRTAVARSKGRHSGYDMLYIWKCRKMWMYRCVPSRYTSYMDVYLLSTHLFFHNSAFNVYATGFLLLLCS
ncbi:hypothetical protein MKX01_030613 [Papaver californicum]|nr:hypothetical protein MKX01_030613 [Papaver californicum]